VVPGTHNIYVLSPGAKVAFTHNDLTPIAAMAFAGKFAETAGGPLEEPGLAN
jgi:hypothetical protein